MRYLDLTLPDPAANLALDEALLLEVDGGAEEVLRVWEWPTHAGGPAHVVVLGSGCRLGEDVDEAACRADGVPILRRASGGGTVLWGGGCLLFSLALRYDRDPLLNEVRPSYGWILGRIAAAVGLPGVEQAGISDLAFGGRKFSGNAQQRKQNALLHHGTLLYAFNLPLVSRYLKPPPRQPDYRGRREHLDFLLNLPFPATDLKQRLRDAWQADRDETAWPVERVRELCQEKYEQPDWVRRR
jgi:lipoate-protein ligase A